VTGRAKLGILACLALAVPLMDRASGDGAAVPLVLFALVLIWPTRRQREREAAREAARKAQWMRFWSDLWDEFR
jgi:hypothetical protein